MLNQSKGKDLLAAAKSASAAGGGTGPLASAGMGGGSGAAGGGPRLPLTTFDEDFLQAGAVIEGARTYVMGTVFVAAQAVQLVFLKVGGKEWAQQGVGCWAGTQAEHRWRVVLGSEWCSWPPGEHAVVSAG